MMIENDSEFEFDGRRVMVMSWQETRTRAKGNSKLKPDDQRFSQIKRSQGVDATAMQRYIEN
jgi:hypothetical protein